MSAPSNEERPSNRFAEPPKFDDAPAKPVTPSQNPSGPISATPPQNPAAPTSHGASRFGASAPPVGSAVPTPTPPVTPPPSPVVGSGKTFPPPAPPAATPFTPPAASYLTPPAGGTVPPVSPSYTPPAPGLSGGRSLPAAARTLLTLSVVACLLVGGFFVGKANKWWQPAPEIKKEEPKPPPSIPSIAIPATVLIKTTFEATVQVPEVKVDVEKLQARFNAVQLPPGASEEDQRKQEDEIFFANPEEFLIANTQMRNRTVKIVSQGSGFICSPDGYVITNAHVVTPNQQIFKNALLKSALNEDAEKFSQIRHTKDDNERLLNALVKFYQANTSVGDVSKEVRAVLNSSGTETRPQTDGLKCEVKKVGQVYPGKDVAVLKMTGSNLPMLPLAANLDKKELNVGDELTVVGYPAVATFDKNFDTSKPAECSVIKGTVVSIPTMKEGWKIIQTNATGTHGNSGGPVLNKSGEVVGIFTATTIDEEGKEVVGFYKVVPVDILREFLKEAGVTLP